MTQPNFIHISEYADYARDASTNRILGVTKEPPLVEQSVAVGGSSAQSAAFGANTRLIRVSAGVICSILVGANPTATTESRRLVAGHTELMAVTPGHKIAVISNI